MKKTLIAITIATLSTAALAETSATSGAGAAAIQGQTANNAGNAQTIVYNQPARHLHLFHQMPDLLIGQRKVTKQHQEDNIFLGVVWASVYQ
jgi:hypothetical protein